MCKPASFIVTKEQVFWSKTTDSHEDIIAEFGLHPDGARGPNICRVELVPADGLYWTDPATWEFNVDQDIRPDWFDLDDATRRVKAAALNWQAAKIVKPEQKRDAIKDGEFVLFNYGTVQAIWGGTVREIRGGTVQAIWGGTVQEIWGGTVQAISGGTVQAISGGTVQAYTQLDPAILKSPYAVLIDRSGNVPVCYVGKEQA